ncbi:acyl-CoA/acyl-ACP dehydrogenase [Pseudomaricurvus alkylphenolicus]|uniref:acyl-CoA dehydrogenase family protein n=1 Tax=Pseudomaricurvus alkylphenolicus TaxID=1306991 RepID=UPI0014217DC4|nr:acyl-CoA dehydrogenase family protein [Pseudomaricurvus alkylphenolicus]NIB42205.1 acyl-CoA/acyl-ACP dehydrogenase [Pseudomaricurvus alkylphenolicus]
MNFGQQARNHKVDSLNFSEEQKMILESARSFCEDTSSIEQVRELLDSSRGYEESVWAQLVELGWTGIAVPERFGGSELGIETVVPIVESMGRSLSATPFISCTLSAQILLQAGSTDQQQRWLPRIVEGQIATVALLDNEDWGAFSTTQELNDELVLKGEKWFVDDAVSAELFIVLTQYQGNARFVMVTRNQLEEGAVQAHALIDETKRSARVDFTGVSVSAEAILVAEDTSEILNDIKLIGALLTAAEAVGATSSCLNLMVEYLNTRKQFGKLIGSYQALKHPCVDILTKLEGARSQVYHAATLFEEGQGKMDRDLEVACRMAKASANDALLMAGDRAVQFHGGMGFTYECDAQLYIRRAQWSQQQFGESAHHRKRLAPLLLSL